MKAIADALLAGRIPGMATKKKGDSPKKKPNRKPAFILYGRIDPDIGHDFSNFVEALRPKTSNAAVMEMLIERYLVEQGVRAPKEEGN
jgi:hypothetical protein